MYSYLIPDQKAHIVSLVCSGLPLESPLSKMCLENLQSEACSLHPDQWLNLFTGAAAPFQDMADGAPYLNFKTESGLR